MLYDKERSKQITIEHNNVIHNINTASRFDLVMSKHVAVFIFYKKFVVFHYHLFISFFILRLFASNFTLLYLVTSVSEMKPICCLETSEQIIQRKVFIPKVGGSVPVGLNQKLRSKQCVNENNGQV